MNHHSIPAAAHLSAARSGADDWLTRKEAAVLMGRSEDTVKRAIQRYGLATRTGDNNATLLRLGDLVDRGLIAADNLPAAGNAAQTLADLRRVQADLAAASQQLAAHAARLEERAGVIEQLKAQLSAKDKQLDNLYRIMQNLSAGAPTRLGGAA